MLTKEEIEKIAKQKYPEKWESHYPTHMADDGWTDENAEKRRAFIEGVMLGLSVGRRYLENDIDINIYK